MIIIIVSVTGNYYEPHIRKKKPLRIVGSFKYDLVEKFYRKITT